VDTGREFHSFFNFGTSRSSVVDFRAQSLYSWEINPVSCEEEVRWVPESVWTEEEINIFPYWASNPGPSSP
jgi:hypothetical protein